MRHALKVDDEIGVHIRREHADILKTSQVPLKDPYTLQKLPLVAFNFDFLTNMTQSSVNNFKYTFFTVKFAFYRYDRQPYMHLSCIFICLLKYFARKKLINAKLNV